MFPSTEREPLIECLPNGDTAFDDARQPAGVVQVVVPRAQKVNRLEVAYAVAGFRADTLDDAVPGRIAALARVDQAPDILT